jgi:ABC-type transport system substrate-binding protein
MKERYALLKKNEHFFGQGSTIAGRKLGPEIDGIVFKIYDALAIATLALSKGDIDFLWEGVSHSLVGEIADDPNISLLMSLARGYRYLGFNLRKKPFSDPSFRQAIAYLIDKDFIIKHILHEHGVRADSVIPTDNRLYFNSETPSYGRGLDRDERTGKAFQILNAAGYHWDTTPIDGDGAARKGKGLMTPDGKAIPPLTLLTPPPDYDTERAATGKVIQEWLQDFGIPVVWKSMAFDGLIRMVRHLRDFDLYILGWRNMSHDPDYLRRFFHSTYDHPGEWNDTGYRNTRFDRMADLQAMTIDIQERKSIVLDLQSQLMKDLPIIPLYVPHRMEAIRTGRFSGWTTAEGGYGGVWSFSLLKPTEK